MLNAVTNLIGTALRVTLQGSLDENTDLARSIGTSAKEMDIWAKEVSRINSHGIREWVKFFTELGKNGVKIRFHELSPALMHPLNLIANFVPGDSQIISICLPYFCSACKTQFITVLEVSQLQKLARKPPNANCPKCSAGKAVFDDLDTEYFQFMGFKKK